MFAPHKDAQIDLDFYRNCATQFSKVRREMQRTLQLELVGSLDTLTAYNTFLKRVVETSRLPAALAANLQKQIDHLDAQLQFRATSTPAENAAMYVQFREIVTILQHKMTQRLDRMLMQNNAPRKPIVQATRAIVGTAQTCNVYDAKIVVTLQSSRLTGARSFEHVINDAADVCAVYTLNDAEMTMYPNRSSWLSHCRSLINREVSLLGRGWSRVREED